MSKYKVTVWQRSGSTVHPIIEADNSLEAIRIAKKQYPDAKNISGAVQDHSSTDRYRITVWPKSGSSVQIIVEARSSAEARRLAEAQFPDAKSIGAASRA